MSSAIWIIILCGALSIVYGVWATRSVLAADAGNKRMQEIAGAIQEGAQAYLTRQYTTIAIAGVIIFFIVMWLLGLPVACRKLSRKSEYGLPRRGRRSALADVFGSLWIAIPVRAPAILTRILGDADWE